MYLFIQPSIMVIRKWNNDTLTRNISSLSIFDYQINANYADIWHVIRREIPVYTVIDIIILIAQYNYLCA